MKTLSTYLSEKIFLYNGKERLTKDIFWGKIIIIITMYLGRVGPISLAVAFNLERKIDNIIKYPVEEIRVG